MKLKDCEVELSAVIDVNDDKKLGRIKVCKPGEYAEDMDTECLPWVYPFEMNHYQSFSKLIKGAKVWTIKNKDNYDEYYYIPYPEQITVVKNYLAEHYEDDPEVIIARDNLGEDNTATLVTYDSKEGFVIKIKGTSIEVKPNNQIICKTPDVNVDIKDGVVYCGDPNGGFEPMIYGNKLVDVLNNLRNGFNSLYSACGGYTEPLRPGFEQCRTALESVNELLTKASQCN